MNIVIEQIFISSDHNYVGHHGGPPGAAPAECREQVVLLPGRGIEGDRYAARDAGHPKQITFFDMAVIDGLSAKFNRPVPPQSVRRNVFVRGLDLPKLVGRRFRLNGIRFEGVDPCKPCYWMNQAVGPGAEEFLRGKGGLRARILDPGLLRIGAGTFELLEDAE
jgi:MOSC domain-containing protein YiiM